MQNMIIFGLIKSLHDLFTVLWVGGILTTAISFMPAIQRSKGKASSEALSDLLGNYSHRLRNIAVVSIIGLWITGLLLTRQSSASGGGFMRFSTPYEVLISVKHLLVFIMVIIAVVRGFFVGGNIFSFTPSQKKLSMALLLLNVILGVAVIFISGISAALG
jgi:uncharacterized membrane protein